MGLGKVVGENLATDPTFLPEVPRYPVFEQKLEGKLGRIPLIGYLDSFDPDTKNFYEYKTSANPKRWTHKTANQHGQLLFYSYLIWYNYKMTPQSHLTYIPVVDLQVAGTPITYPVRHSFTEVLVFMKGVKSQYAEMIKYAQNHA